jgi:hypothetical protein
MHLMCSMCKDAHRPTMPGSAKHGPGWRRRRGGWTCGCARRARRARRSARTSCTCSTARCPPPSARCAACWRRTRRRRACGAGLPCPVPCAGRQACQACRGTPQHEAALLHLLSLLLLQLPLAGCTQSWPLYCRWAGLRSFAPALLHHTCRLGAPRRLALAGVHMRMVSARPHGPGSGVQRGVLWPC